MKDKLLDILLIVLALVAIASIIFVGAKSVGASWCPLKKGSTPEEQERICYAWNISQDINWILTLERESGFSPDAISPINYDGSRDYTICQLNSRYHWSFIASNPSWEQQLHYCAGVYASSGGTDFYGYFKRFQVIDRFIIFNN